MRGAAEKLERKNVIVDSGKVRRLKKILGLASDSATIRAAVDRALGAEAAVFALERLRKRGTWGKALATRSHAR